MGLSQARHREPTAGQIDVIGDIIESANLVIRHPRTASVVLGGGTPKNFINQASVQAEFYDDRVGGHRYALQIVTDVPHFGGASGSSLEEAQSWGKLATDAEQVTVHADATIALPASRQRARNERARDARRPEAAALRSFRSDHGRQRPAVSAGAFRGPRDELFRSTTTTGAPLAFGGALPTSPLVRRRRASSSFPCPSIARRPTSAARATARARSCRRRRTWSCGTRRCGADVHGVGIFTLPEMELPFGELAPLMDEIERVAYEIVARDKFLVTLGGEHSITPPLVAAAAAALPGAVGAADRRARRPARLLHGHACTTTRARCAARWISRR